MLDAQALIKNFTRSLDRNYSKPINEHTARLVVKSILADLLRESYPLLLGFYELQSSKKLQMNSEYYTVIEHLVGIDSISAAYQLSSIYSLLICQDRRYRDGIYFTPPELSNRVILEISAAYSGDLSKSRIIDPCAGGGAFLAPLMSNSRLDMKKRGIQPNQRLRQISKNVVGIEVCKTLTELSEIFCMIELYPDIESEQFVPQLQINSGDYLRTDFVDKSFDVVIGNPPFRRISASEKTNYSEEFGVTRNGGSNLYGLFIQKALSLLRPGGVIGFVIPASLFSGARYAQLRSFISGHADVVSIQTIRERVGVFMDVQQETAIITLKKIAPGVKRRKLAKIATICKEAKSKPIGRFKIAHNCGPWIIPRNRKQAEAAKLFSKDLPRLEDYGITIRTGSVVWNRDNRPRYAKREQAIANNETCYPLIWSDCIGVDGSFDLERAKARAPADMFVGTEETDPDLLRSSAIAIKRTSNTKQSRRIYSAYISSAFVQTYGAYLGENHINLLMPQFHTSVVEMKVLVQMLNSDPVDVVFRCLSGSSTVSKYELCQLPLPDLKYVQKLIGDGFGIDDAVSIGFYE